MTKINELVEWDSCGSKFSVYVKHYVDDDGRKGMTMIYEDVTGGAVTEMRIPSRAFPAFLKAVNGTADRYRGII